MADDVRRGLSVVRASAAAGVALGLLVILCWIGAFIPFASPTHAFIGLFTPADLHSTRALLEGTLWAFLFGLIAGAVIAITYNSLARLER